MIQSMYIIFSLALIVGPLQSSGLDRDRFASPPAVPFNVCVGLTSFVVGIGIGIGIGALIFDRPWHHGRFGGGIWFGKRRRRRDVQEDARGDEDTRRILKSIYKANQEFGD